MSIDSRQIFATLQGYASRSGLFDAVPGHEPKAAPSLTGVTCAVQFMKMGPCTSGLAALSVRVEMWYRIFTSMLQEPQDDIDPRVMDAADALFTAMCGDVDFGSQARYIDLQGSDGEPLSAEAGYITVDQKTFRTIDIKVPILINDAYVESA